MSSAEDIAMRPFINGFDWGMTFRRARRRGYDHGWCAYVADRAQEAFARKNGYRKRKVKP